MEIDTLIAFIVKAKKNTYAAGKNKIAPVRPGSIDLVYEDAGYSYCDSYFGNTFFSGQEIVYKNKTPLWSMNYYGKVLKPDLPDGFSETLKGALVLVDAKAPFRGPEKYTHGNYDYQRQYIGDFEFFNGVEHILLNGEEVYRLYFHGGLVE